MIKLFVSDIDGTLVNDKSEFEKETIDAIRRFQSFGGIFMVATGRNIWELKQFTSQLDGIVFNCANGSLLCDQDLAEIISYALDRDSVLKFVKLTKKFDCIGQYHCRNLCCTTADEKRFYQEALTAFKRDKHLNDEESIRFYHRVYDKKKMRFSLSLEEILTHEPLKLELLFAEAERFPQIYEECVQLLPECKLAPETFMHNIEISSGNSGKGKIILDYCRTKGIAEDEVAVIGDSNNDIDMLKLFRNSYAMGNAPDEVKRHAAFITDDNRHLGVAKVLNRIIREQSE